MCERESRDYGSCVFWYGRVALFRNAAGVFRLKQLNTNEVEAIQCTAAELIALHDALELNLKTLARELDARSP